MTSRGRWTLWALGLVLLVAVPVTVRALPAAESDLTAAELLARVQDAKDAPYAGYVETSGTVALPLSEGIEGVGSLLGETTRMRVWWRNAESWRVDRLKAAGETDLIHVGDRTTEWDYERSQADTSVDPDIRLPRTADLIPSVLGDRVVAEARSEDVARIPSRRVAGVDAAGLRILPASQASSIDHVDLWADPATGIPLRLEVVALGSSAPSFVSELGEFTAGVPAPETVVFRPPPEAETTVDEVLDIADAANQYAPFRPPEQVAGLAKSSSARGAVGVYGEGLTELISIPLRDQEAEPLRDQLARTPGATLVDRGVVVTLGPLSVMLTGDEGGWLIAGTVTAETLVAAAADIERDTRVIEEAR